MCVRADPIALTIPWANAGNDRFFGGSPDQLQQIRADCHPYVDAELDAVSCDCAQRVLAAKLRIGAVDHLGRDAGTHRVEHISAGEINCGRTVEVQVDVGTISGDNGAKDPHDVSPREEMGFQASGAHAALAVDIQTRLRTHDFGDDDRTGMEPGRKLMPIRLRRLTSAPHI